MKTKYINTVFITFFIILLAISASGQPLPTQHGGGGGNWVGGQAPLGGDQFFLFILCSLYAGAKTLIHKVKAKK